MGSVDARLPGSGWDWSLITSHVIHPARPMVVVVPDGESSVLRRGNTADLRDSPEFPALLSSRLVPSLSQFGASMRLVVHQVTRRSLGGDGDGFQRADPPQFLSGDGRGAGRSGRGRSGLFPAGRHCERRRRSDLEGLREVESK